jgi:hypothetical protein
MTINPDLLPDLTVQEALALNRRYRLEMARIAAARQEVLLWGKCLFPHKFPLPFCDPLHPYLISIRGDPKTATQAPRGHSKTTVDKFLIPIFQGIYEPEKFRHYLQVQATETKALAANNAIRIELEENEDLKDLVGDLRGARWTNEQFVLKSGVCYTAVSAGQSIRGINYRNNRPDFIMPDDLYNEDHIHNIEQTEKINDWFWSTLYPARAQGRRTAIHLTGTATNEADIMNRISKLPDWKFRTFKAITDWEKKTVLWPEKNTFESLMQDMAAMTSTIFMREMQNEIFDELSSLVKRAWIKEYDPANLYPAGTFQYVGCYLGVDPSIGDKEENDFTAIALIYVYRYTDGKGYFYFIDQLWNEHLTLDKRVKLLQDIQDRQPQNRKITLAFIEGIAGFKDFVAEVRRRTTLPVRQVPEPGKKIMDKLANLEVKAWLFENGRVSINKNIDSKLKENWIYQMCNNRPRYDDMRDATLLPLEMPKSDALAYMD